jgi:hypothetical protein
VAHELTGHPTVHRKTAAIHDVVEPGLTYAHELLAGDTLRCGRLGVVAAELLLEDPVETLGLLLLTQL